MRPNEAFKLKQEITKKKSNFEIQNQIKNTFNNNRICEQQKKYLQLSRQNLSSKKWTDNFSYNATYNVSSCKIAIA